MRKHVTAYAIASLSAACFAASALAFALERKNPARDSIAQKKTPRRLSEGVFRNNSLTMTYFHTGCSTIIGAKSFHGPVRDGKGWYQLAMVIRHDL